MQYMQCVDGIYNLLKEAVIDLFGHIQPPHQCDPRGDLHKDYQPTGGADRSEHDDEECCDDDGERHIEELDDFVIVHEKEIH